MQASLHRGDQRLSSGFFTHHPADEANILLDFSDRIIFLKLKQPPAARSSLMNSPRRKLVTKTSCATRSPGAPMKLTPVDREDDRGSKQRK
jgi:hypothetical protein